MSKVLSSGFDHHDGRKPKGRRPKAETSDGRVYDPVMGKWHFVEVRGGRVHVDGSEWVQEYPAIVFRGRDDAYAIDMAALGRALRVPPGRWYTFQTKVWNQGPREQRFDDVFIVEDNPRPTLRQTIRQRIRRLLRRRDSEPVAAQ